MRKLIFLLAALIPILAASQNIRINQIRSTGEPANRSVLTDGSNSLKFGDIDVSLITDLDSAIVAYLVEYGGVIQNGFVVKPNVVKLDTLTFSVSPSAYYINGDFFTTSDTTLTFDNADPADPRLDILVVDTTGQVDIITGTAATNPVKPIADPVYQIELTTVLIPAGENDAYSPGGETISDIVIYNENTEWTTGSFGTTVDFDDTGNPFVGSKAASVGSIGQGDYLSFITGSPVDVTDYSTLSFYLYLNEVATNKNKITVSLFSGATSVSNLTIMPFDYTMANDWQLVTVSLDDMGITDRTSIDKVFVFWNKSGPQTDLASGFYLDYFRFQSNVQQPPSIDLSGYWSKTEITPADTTYWNAKLDAEVDGSVTNEIQTISISNDTIFLSENGGFVELPAGTVDTDDQTASEVSVTDAGDYFSSTDVEGALQELGSDIATSGDGWGSDTVVHDESLIGKGIDGDTLRVNTDSFPTYIDVDIEIQSQINNAYQKIDTAQLTGTDLELSLQNDNEPKKVIDLSSLQDGTGTDDQTLSIDSTDRVFTISIEGGNSVSFKDSLGTDDQTAAEVSVTDAGDYFTGDNVETILQEIGSDIASGGDGWGSDVANTDATLSGDGTVGNVLKVDTTLIATLYQMRSDISDTAATITPNATHTGEVTGATALTVADNVIDYANVDETLKDTIVDNDVSWDMSAHSIVYSAVSGAIGTMAISNAQINKTMLVVLTISSFTSLTVPANIHVLTGSADFADGVFYLYIHCIGTNNFTMTIIQEAP